MMRIRQSKYGFSLVELLVVIGIIAILATVVFSLAQSGLNSARRAGSSNNLRQIGLALRQFAADNNGHLPKTTHGNPHDQSWIHTLGPYTSELNEIRICPSDPQRKARLAGRGTSYVMNEYVTVPQYGLFGSSSEDYTKLDNLSVPSETFVTFIGADELPVHVTADHTHSRGWTAGWETVIRDISPDRFRTHRRAKDRSEGDSLYLMADGRVQNLKADEVKRMSEKTPDWARPPE